MDIPDNLDLEYLRGKGLQPGEEELPNEGAQPQFVPNEEIVSVLIGMGFPRERCVKAAYYTGNNSIDEASNWLFSHMDDPGKIPKLKILDLTFLKTLINLLNCPILLLLLL